jgi:hypothetical protein
MFYSRCVLTYCNKNSNIKLFFSKRIRIGKRTESDELSSTFCTPAKDNWVFAMYQATSIESCLKIFFF